MLLSKCALCSSKKSRFMRKQEVIRILNSLSLKTPLNKIPLLGDLLLQVYKMNDIVKNVLLAEDKFMTEMHLK